MLGANMVMRKRGRESCEDMQTENIQRPFHAQPLQPQSSLEQARRIEQLSHELVCAHSTIAQQQAEINALRARAVTMEAMFRGTFGDQCE